MEKPIYDIEVEKTLLAGLLQYPTIFPEISKWVNENDFGALQAHRVVFSLLKKRLESGLDTSPIIIAQEVKDLNIKFKEIDDLYLYLQDSLSLIQISPKGAIESAQQLKNVTVQRELDQIGRKIQNHVRTHKSEKANALISECDQIYGKTLNYYQKDNEPTDLFQGVEEYIEELGNSKDEDSKEIVCPYPNYHKLFGGFFPGDLVLFASAPKSGKSTLLLDLMIKACNHANNNVRGLIIDSELETYRVQRRMVASLAQVKEYFLKSNKWRKNPELVKKVREVWPIIKKYFGTIQHIYVGNMDFPEVISLIRRWHFKIISKSSFKPMVAYDYFKLTSVDGAKDAYQGSMTLGQKVDAFKKLASELQMPILGSCQTNALNEERKDSKNRIDSGRGVGLSYEMGKFASAIYLFQRKALDELAEEGTDASHKLIPLYTRDLGEQGTGFNDLVKIGDKWRQNHINFNISDFSVTELDTLKDRAAKINGHLNIQDPHKDDHSELTL